MPIIQPLYTVGNIAHDHFGIIYDMDGVIADTQQFHAFVEQKILEQYHITHTTQNGHKEQITDQRINHYCAGIQPKIWMKKLFDEHHIPFDEEVVEIQKNDALIKLYTHHPEIIKEIPWAIALIKNCKEAWFKQGILTASTRICLMKVLQTLQVYDDFDIRMSMYDDDVKHTNKADPKPFEIMTTKLDIHPSKFVMIEDGNAGIQWAQKAGGKAIAVYGTQKKPEDFPTANIHIQDLQDLSEEIIYCLLTSQEIQVL